MTEAEILEHIAKAKDPPGLDKYIKSRCCDHYIFFNNKEKRATCTRCEKTFKTRHNYKHKSQVKCPHCDSWLEARSEGKGRNSIEDTFRLMTYTRYRKTIYAKLYYILVKYNDKNALGKYENKVVINKELKFFYIFNKKEIHNCYKDTDWYRNENSWKERTSTGCNIPNPSSGCYFYYSSRYEYLTTYPSMRENQTYYRDMFEKSDAKHLFDNLNVFNHIRVSDRENELMLKYLEYGLKNQSIELLAKAGFESLVINRIHGCTGGCNWRGKTLTSILKVPHREFDIIRAMQPSLKQLETFRSISEEDKRQLPDKVLAGFCVSYRNTPDHLEELKEDVKLKRWGLYIEEQAKDYDEELEGVHKIEAVIGDYRDYLSMAKKCGMNINKSSILYPENLKEAHDAAIQNMKVRKNKIKNKAIKAHAIKIDFESKETGLKVVVPMSQTMLNKESSGLNHCVKTYGDRLADGKCRIFFIRKTDAEDVPFYTLETRPDGEFVQCRGKNNCSMTGEVEQFKDEFIKYLKKEIKKGDKQCQKKIA